METIAQQEQPESPVVRNRVVVNLDVQIDRAIEIEAARQNMTKRDLIEEAVREYLKLPK